MRDRINWWSQTKKKVDVCFLRKFYSETDLNGTESKLSLWKAILRTIVASKWPYILRRCVFEKKNRLSS